MDFAFEDDLFEPVKQRKSFENTVNDAIKKYVAKEVTPKVIFLEKSFSMIIQKMANKSS